VGAGDDVFLTDDFSERDDAIGYEFRVLDEVGRVADGAGDKDFSGGGLTSRRTLNSNSKIRGKS
jgi:hypothetical protein